MNLEEQVEKRYSELNQWKDEEDKRRKDHITWKREQIEDSHRRIDELSKKNISNQQCIDDVDDPTTTSERRIELATMIKQNNEEMKWEEEMIQSSLKCIDEFSHEKDIVIPSKEEVRQTIILKNAETERVIYDKEQEKKRKLKEQQEREESERKAKRFREELKREEEEELKRQRQFYSSFVHYHNTCPKCSIAFRKRAANPEGVDDGFGEPCEYEEKMNETFYRTFYNNEKKK